MEAHLGVGKHQYLDPRLLPLGMHKQDPGKTHRNPGHGGVIVPDHEKLERFPSCVLVS